MTGGCQAPPIAFLLHCFRMSSLLEDKRQALFVVITAALACGLVSAVFGPVKAVALAVGLIVFLIGFARPTHLVLFLAVYTPFEPFLLKFVPDVLYVYARYFSESLIYVLLASVVLHAFLRRERLRSTPLDLPFIFFILTAVTSLILNAVPPFYGLLGLRQIVRFMLLFFAVVHLRPSETFMKRITVVMFAVVMFQGVLGLAQGFIGAPLDEFLIPSERKFFESVQLTSGTEQFWSPGARVFATLGRYDQLGTFLSFFFLLAVGLAYTAKDFSRKKQLLAVIAVAAPAFLLTLSRASWFGFAIGLAVIGAWLMKDVRVRLGFSAIVVAALGYLAWTGITVRYLTDYPEQGAVERFFETFSYERWRGEYYGVGRLFWIVQTPLIVVRSSPFFGVGPGQFGGGAAAALGNTRVYEKLNLPFGIQGTEGYIDNNWFAIWGETGTIGLMLYSAMFFVLGRLAYRLWRKARDPFAKGLALGFLGALIAVSFQAFLATYLEVRTLALYLWLYAAFVVVLARKEGVA